jgi:DUF438 domain-containing protein
MYSNGTGKHFLHIGKPTHARGQTRMGRREMRQSSKAISYAFFRQFRLATLTETELIRFAEWREMRHSSKATSYAFLILPIGIYPFSLQHFSSLQNPL